MKRTPVIVISGFLGSGKTTFLRFLLKNSNKKFGLIINEFGDVGIDGDLVRDCSSSHDSLDECVIELNNGCLCCKVQEDFIPSITKLLSKDKDIEFILIETSGLALPIPLLKALNWPEIRSKIYLDLVIGIVNGESMLNGSPINNLDEINIQHNNIESIEHNASIEELFEEQLEVSDLVVISRSDLLDENEFNLVEKQIKNLIKANIPIIPSFNGQIDMEYLFDGNIKRNTYQAFITEEHTHNHPKLFSHSLKCDYFLDKKEFDQQMFLILNELNILRIKGRVWIPGKSFPLQIQIVGRKINTWYEAAPIDCWKPKHGGGLEITMIGFEKITFELLSQKIKEKFNILHVPKLRK